MCLVYQYGYKKRHENLILVKKYTSEEYPRYDNYDAIEVSKTADIPCDYAGVMGVPITFLDKYNPDQFEILGLSNTVGAKIPEDTPKNLKGGARFYLRKEGALKRCYERLVIRNKHPEVSHGDKGA